MITTQDRYNVSTLQRPLWSRIILMVMFVAASLVSYSLSQEQQKLDRNPGMMFQSVLPHKTRSEKPASWVFAGEGGTRKNGPITIILPGGFTNQGGANVFADSLTSASTVLNPQDMVAGTEFAVGIWPANEQTQFQQPIEIRIAINAAKLPTKDKRNLTLMMYNPQNMIWEAQPSQFVDSTLEVVARVQLFKPVAKDFPSWGGRTLFCVVNRVLYQTSTSTNPKAKQTGNLRSGPGLQYPIVGKVAQSQPLEIVEKSVDGQWYKLSNQMWIAAFLVSNPPELPAAKPIPSLTATP